MTRAAYLTMRQTLDGMWEFRPATEEGLGDQEVAPNPDARFETTPIRVPGYWNSLPPELGGDWAAYEFYRYPAHWQQVRAAWYRRKFRPDTGLCNRRQRVRLYFDAVAGRTMVWLNGVRLGSNDDGFLPFRFDVDKILKAHGENELLVRVDAPPSIEGLWLQPCGSWVGWHLRGIWQSVYLEARPAHALADVFVQPSVRRSQLAVDVALEPMDVPADVSVRVSVLDQERVVKDCGLQPVRIGRDSGTVRFEAPWTDARCWCPEDPHLYHAEIELRVSGRTVHRRRVRFGFREFWIEGTGFRLNGKPMRLFGDSWHYMGVVQQNPAYARTWFRLARDTGVNVIRTHAMPYPPCYFEVADEMGMMLVDESAIYGSAGTLAFEREQFWDNARDHVRRLVRRDRNHPSVIFWSACNETVWKGGEAIFDQLCSLGAEARRLDPTRFTSYDENDCDLRGRALVHAGHYGTPAHWEKSWRRNQPLVLHEFCALYHGGPENVSHLGDEQVYASYAARLHATGVDAANMFLRMREMGAASITPWNINWYCGEPVPAAAVESVPPECTAGGPAFDRIGSRALTLNYGYVDNAPAFLPNPAYAPLKACYVRRRFYLPHRPRQVFAGATIGFAATLWNDTAEPLFAKLSFALRLARDDAACWTGTAHLAAVTSSVQKIVVEAPFVNDPTRYEAVLVLQAAGSGEILFEERWPVYVHPQMDGTRDRVRKTLVMGALCDLGQILPDAALISGQAEALAEIATAADAKLTIILTGRSDGRTLLEWLADETIDRWLRDGGRLIVLPGGLADDAATALPRIRRSCTMVYPRDASGGLTRGLAADYWRDWSDDGVVAVEVYPRPVAGAALVPLDVGEPAEGLHRTPLVVIPHGAGHIVLSGMRLLERAADTPAAAILLRRLLRDPMPAAPTAPVTLPARADSTWSGFARAVGVVEESAASILLCDGGDSAQLNDPRLQPEALRAHWARGGTLLLSTLTPATSAPWAQRLGLPLRLEAGEHFNVARSGTPDRLAGLNNFDFCWVNRDEKQPIVRHTLEVNAAAYTTLVETVATRWEDYQTAPEQYKVAMMYRRIEQFRGPRAVLVEACRGPGRILICQLLLEEARGSFAERAQRIMSRLLDQVGAARQGGASLLTPRPRHPCNSDGFITQWLILGPYSGTRDHPLDHAFVDESALCPENGVEQGGRTWRYVESPLEHVNLRGAFTELAERDRVAYAAAYVWAPQDRSILLGAPDMVALRVASDGGNKVFLNRQALGRFDFVRELVLDGDCVPGVPLRQGWNLLIIKLHNPSGPWRFAARFVTAAGAPAGDLRIQPERPRGVGGS